jgi:transcriptional regulator with XRE-family HTH domain
MRNNYKTRRRAIGWTMEQFAAAAGVSLSTIVRAELHKRISPLASRAIEQALTVQESIVNADRKEHAS